MIENIQIKIRNKKLRKILFIIALVVGLTFLSIGILRLAVPKPGYFEINASSDSITKSYARNFSLNAYIEGNRKAINLARREYEEQYSSSLKKYSISYSEYYNDDRYIGINYINNHINEEVIVSNELFNDLKDAYNKTINSTNFSLFASVLYYEWDKLCFNYNNLDTTLDPLINNEEKQLINNLVSYINNLDNFNLEFNDTKNSVKLSVSSEYINFLKDNSINYPIMSFNKLYEAYVLKNVSKSLKDFGFENFYLRSSEGLVINYDKSNNLVIDVYDLNKLNYYSYSLNNISNSSTISKYSNDDLNPSYIFNYDNKDYYRSNNLNINSGECNDYLINVSINSNDILNTAFLINELNSISNQSELNNYLINHSDVEFIFVIKDNINVIYTYNLNKISNVTTNDNYKIVSYVIN